MAKSKLYYSMFVDFFEKNKNRNRVENLYRSLGLLQKSIMISKVNLSFPVFCLHSYIVLSRYFVVSVNSMIT